MLEIEGWGPDECFVEMARITSKGQVTIPAPIRKIFSLKKGSTVVFRVTHKGVLFSPCEIKAKDTFSPEEWEKIERLAAERGKVFKTAKRAAKHLKDL
jgi:AbrB family looped-hinge helix DNA binding protein